MGNYGTRNARPVTKEMRRENRKKNLAIRKMTKKQRAVYEVRQKLAANIAPNVFDFVEVFDKLKVKTPIELFRKRRQNPLYFNDGVLDFAEKYAPYPKIPEKGNPKRERRSVR